MRQFETGATRDDDTSKPDYEGFLSPVVLEHYGEYMSKHRVQADGKIRDSDNWQKGIPQAQYLKSLIRHVFTLWKLHRMKGTVAERREMLMAIVFNAFGYDFELTRESSTPSEYPGGLTPNAYSAYRQTPAAAVARQTYPTSYPHFHRPTRDDNPNSLTITCLTPDEHQRRSTTPLYSTWNLSVAYLGVGSTYSGFR